MRESDAASVRLPAAGAIFRGMTEIPCLPDEIRPPEVQAVLAHMLSSTLFAKSQRMSRLLRFVVEKTIAGEARQLNEYAIGLEVFDRDATTYSPGDDPIVRVQVGRLRDKLQTYYANEQDHPTIRFDIPLGTYVPTIKRVAPGFNKSAQRKVMILPIRSITFGAAGAEFAQGLQEELVHHLFMALGEIALPLQAGDKPSDPISLTAATEASGAGYMLEGSIRTEAAQVRVSLRLVEVRSGGLVWSEQFNRRIDGTLATQEELASAICQSLSRYLVGLG